MSHSETSTDFTECSLMAIHVTCFAQRHLLIVA